MARGKTTPASTAGSYAPASGRTSRVEIDTLADTQAEREQARIDRLWNCDDVTQVLSFHVAAWPHTKAGVAKLRGELASMGAATFAIRHDLDLRFDPMSKATPEETAAYCQAWLDNLEATKGTGERANQKVLDAMRATEEPVPAPTPVAGDGGYEALHRFDIGEDSSVEVFRSGRGFKVIRFNDGIGAEHGGDFFGADGTVFGTEAAALAVARRWAGVGGDEPATPSPDASVNDDDAPALHVFEIGYDSTIEVCRSGNGFKIIWFDDETKSEYGGDDLGANGTVFGTEDEAVDTAKRLANTK